MTFGLPEGIPLRKLFKKKQENRSENHLETMGSSILKPPRQNNRTLDFVCQIVKE